MRLAGEPRNAGGCEFCSAILLSPSGLNLRSSFFGIATNKSINLSDVVDFGFGYPSHSRSAVLRLELQNPTVRTKWMELVRGITGENVNRFLRDIEAEGFRLPKYGDRGGPSNHLGKGEFDAAAHGVDAFGSDADAVAVLPRQLARLLPASAALCAAT
jgi:hypothetical protein